MKKFNFISVHSTFYKQLFFLLFISLFTLSFSLSALAQEAATQEVPIHESSIHKLKASDQLLLETLTRLTTKSFKKKILAVETLSSIKHTQTNIIIEALLNDKLYYRKTNKEVVIIQSLDGKYQLINPITNQMLDLVEKSKIKKIKTNNKLRKKIRGILAQQKLLNGDVNIRQQAINEILKNIKPDSLSLLKTALAKETNKPLKESLNLAIALIEINSSDDTKRINSATLLGNSLYPIAKARLELLIKKDSEGQYIETNTELTSIAEKGIKRINQKQSLYSKLENIFFGLSLGSVLLLASIGLAITFGVMGVINMAHGELMMVGAYTTYLIQLLMPNNIDISLIVAIPAAFIVSGLFGMAIERGVIRHLYSRPLETLLATFGISLILQQLVRTAISAQNVAVQSPSWLSGSWVINPIFSITYNRLFILIFALIIFFLLLLLLKKTSLGLQVRAVSQNRSMAKSMGIKTQWIDSLTFGLGSGVAGIAGVALSQLTNVGPNLGQAYIIDSFMVVVFGGVESLWGTLVAAMTLGIANKFLEPWAGAVMAKIFVLIFLILFIQKKPKGLFPQKGRSTVGS